MMMLKERKQTITRSGLLICSLTLFLFNCTFHNEEDLFSDEVCDTSGDITYSSFVKPIIERNCVTCHNSSLANGNVNLESYGVLSVQVENGRFLGAINHLPGFAPMPQGGTKLSDCTIETIELWISNGYPEN
ncbi:MAG: hypothetical protein WD431_17800 [Cyclobacteriaceae bacterium]